MEPGLQSQNLGTSNIEKVQHAAEYGNAVEQAARQFQLIIIGLWVVNTALIFTQRLLHREKPFRISFLGDKIIELDKDLTEKEKKLLSHADNILFTVNYTLLSFLMALQFFPYGKITN